MKVVRCPGCRGASRVVPEAVGQTVACPRCAGQFLAIEEAVPIPVSKPVPKAASTPRPRPLRRTEVASTAPRRRAVEPVTPPNAQHGPDGHPHIDPVTTLPLSVMIGLALLPFAIPMVWLIAPFAFGQPPMLSLAAPVALAVSASALCMAIVFTIDWSPTTRVKGVFMLVGLAYMAALGLYFLKKDMVDGMKRVVGPERSWKEMKQPDYKVLMPRNAVPLIGWKPLSDRDVKGFQATHKEFAQKFTFVVGTAPDPNVAVAGDEERWFEEIGKSLSPMPPPGQLKGEPLPRLGDDELPGRQWQYPVGGNIRIVRVYRDKDRLFLLSVEGPELQADDRLAERFFGSFAVTKPKLVPPEVKPRR